MKPNFQCNSCLLAVVEPMGAAAHWKAPITSLSLLPRPSGRGLFGGGE